MSVYLSALNDGKEVTLDALVRGICMVARARTNDLVQLIDEDYAILLKRYPKNKRPLKAGP